MDIVDVAYGSIALCIPTEIINGKIAAKAAVAIQPNFVYPPTITVANKFPICSPSGPKNIKTIGTVTANETIGTKNTAIGLGEILNINFSIAMYKNTINNAGKI